MTGTGVGRPTAPPAAGGGPGPDAARVQDFHDPVAAGDVLGRALAVGRLVLDEPEGFTCRVVTGRCGELTAVTTRLGADGRTELTGAGDSLVTSLVLAGAATVAAAGRPPRPLRAGGVWRLEETPGQRGTFDAGSAFADLVLPLRTVADAAAADPARDVAEDADGHPVVRFATSRPLDDEAERYWAALTRTAVQQVCGPAGPPASLLLREHLVRTLATAALGVFPSVVVEQPRGPGFTGPATVRRALEHLHARAGEPLTVTDLAAAAGTGVRALQEAFVRHVGTTPTAHLREVRLERAHRDLVAGDAGAGDSVAAVAERWGFAHHGRFAAAYRARYGVAPSTTLRH